MTGKENILNELKESQKQAEKNIEHFLNPSPDNHKTTVDWKNVNYYKGKRDLSAEMICFINGMSK